MALFTDGPASAFEDLRAQDSQLADVASVEGIDVTTKMGLASGELSLEMSVMLSRVGQSGTSQTYTIANVVVTPALKLWHTYRTLELVYRDAYCNQLNDRYSAKRDQFKQLGVWAKERLVEAGIGVVAAPLGKPEAPDLAVTSGALAAGTYYLGTSWVNAAGEESECSDPTVVTATGSGYKVTVTDAPSGATGWNVYAGTSPDGMTRQNGTPVALGSSWQMSGTLGSGGSAPGDGQEPVSIVPAPRSLRRG
jgi:hypothetical protein